MALSSNKAYITTCISRNASSIKNRCMDKDHFQRLLSSLSHSDNKKGPMDLKHFLECMSVAVQSKTGKNQISKNMLQV